MHHQILRAAGGMRPLHPTRQLHKAAFTCNLQSASRRAPFSTTHQKPEARKNQVLQNVRDIDQFHTYQVLSSSSRTPLLTLWTSSWCPTCQKVAPLMKELVRSGVGEAEGGVLYTEVEFDAPDNNRHLLGFHYMITAIPTLLSFDANEAQVATKVTNAKFLSDRRFLEEWIRTEARRHGNRGGGSGSGFRFIFGGFGQSKQ